MIDSFDFKEPRCALCNGKEFYNPDVNAPIGRIPVDRIIQKVDDCFNKNDYLEAGRLLEYWKEESVSLKDEMGELSIQNELIGYYRKTDRKNEAIKAINRALELVNKLEQSKMASGATVYLNCATAYKAFGDAENALVLYKKAEMIYKKTLDNSDSRFGGLYNNMATVLVDLKRFDEAEKAYNLAINVMLHVQNGQADLAITYVNMAHLFEFNNDKNKTTDCLFKAYELLNDDNLIKNGYYAYVCEKCATSFEYFGYFVISNELNERAREIYERS